MNPNLIFPVYVVRKALESLAGRESGEPRRLREQAQREMDALRDAFNKKIAGLEQVNTHSSMKLISLSSPGPQSKDVELNSAESCFALKRANPAVQCRLLC